MAAEPDVLIVEFEMPHAVAVSPAAASQNGDSYCGASPDFDRACPWHWVGNSPWRSASDSMGGT